MKNPRLLTKIMNDYNWYIDKDDKLIEEMAAYKEVPQNLRYTHSRYLKRLRELDEERYTSIAFYHNQYRRFIAKAYVPKYLKEPKIKINYTENNF